MKCSPVPGLSLRLKDAQHESRKLWSPDDAYPPTKVAGKQSALAIFDIGKNWSSSTSRGRQFPEKSRQLQVAAKCVASKRAAPVELHSSLRRDPGIAKRGCPPPVAGDYPLLSTREDLLAGALQLSASGNAHSMETGTWWSQSVAAAGTEVICAWC